MSRWEVDGEMYLPPSAEVERLHRWFPGLMHSESGPGRWLRDAMVVPGTQLSFGSFDYQVFQVDVLHTTFAAWFSHLVGMFLVNAGYAALLAELVGTPWAAVGFGVLLLGWCGLLALSLDRPGWWMVVVFVVAADVALGIGVSAVMGPWEIAGLWLASGWVVASGHIAEPYHPPRAGHPTEWRLLDDLVWGPPEARHSWSEVLGQMPRMVAFGLLGWLNELWASPRLHAYVVLRMLLGLGYAPDLAAVLDERRDRAWASGNPALDWIGTGGGNVMRPVGEVEGSGTPVWQTKTSR